MIAHWEHAGFCTQRSWVQISMKIFLFFPVFSWIGGVGVQIQAWIFQKKPTSYVNIYAINEFLALTLTYRNKKKGLTIFFYKNRDLDSVTNKSEKA